MAIMATSLHAAADYHIASADAASRADQTELGALDLYDAHGKFIDRIAFAGDRHSLAIDLAHVVPLLLACPCACVILQHLHPSGRAEPSEADILTTRAFAGLLRLLGIGLHDHLIAGGVNRFGFRDEGLL